LSGQQHYPQVQTLLVHLTMVPPPQRVVHCESAEHKHALGLVGAMHC
jgi:hypothetical protein